MSKQTLPNAFRIEERDSTTGAVLAFTEQGWDGPLTAQEAQGRFARQLREHAGRYANGSPFRLVLLGPDRTRRQLTVEPGGDVNTVTSADGTEWHRMYGGWSTTPLDAPIDFAVLAEFHGPIFAGGVR